MTMTWSNPSPIRSDCGEDLEIVEGDTHSRRIESREEFRRWLETILRDCAAGPPDDPDGSSLSNVCSRIWLFAIDCANHYCPECRKALGETAPAVVGPAAGAEQSNNPWDEVLHRFRAAYACTAGTAESEADRLQKYLLNFSSRGHKAMITELWSKGSVSYQRLANLRGRYSVTANADRNAIDRLVAKAETLWSKEGQIRIKKEASGLTLEKYAPEKQESVKQETELPGSRPHFPSAIDPPPS
jgi:hypothetical protein